VASLALISIPINEAKIAFNRMYEFASIKKEEQGSSTITSFEKLKIKNLSFRLAGRRQLLKDINLEVNKNTCIVMNGESGRCKSTEVQIIVNYYAFESGDILVNVTLSIAEIQKEGWRNILGVLPADITVISGNVISNILLGEEDRIENVPSFCQEYG